MTTPYIKEMQSDFGPFTRIWRNEESSRWPASGCIDIWPDGIHVNMSIGSSSRESPESVLATSELLAFAACYARGQQ